MLKRRESLNNVCPICDAIIRDGGRALKPDGSGLTRLDANGKNWCRLCAMNYDLNRMENDQ